MGYTTDFSGALEFNKPVEDWLVEYVNKFSATRRMKRDNEKIKELFPNWEQMCFMGNLGTEGEYFIGGLGFMGQDFDVSVINGNRPASTQPELWCQWIIENNELVWDGGEKFYNYVEWLEYLINNFFGPLGYILNGEISWQGEDMDDCGIIYVEDNYVSTQDGLHVYSVRDIETDILVKELENRGYNVSA